MLLAKQLRSKKTGDNFCAMFMMRSDIPQTRRRILGTIIDDLDDISASFWCIGERYFDDQRLLYQPLGYH